MELVVPSKSPATTSATVYGTLSQRAASATAVATENKVTNRTSKGMGDSIERRRLFYTNDKPRRLAPPEAIPPTNGTGEGREEVTPEAPAFRIAPIRSFG